MKTFSAASPIPRPLRRSSAVEAVPAAEAVSGTRKRRAATGLSKRRTGAGKAGSLPPFSPANKGAAVMAPVANSTRRQSPTGLDQRCKMTEAQIQQSVFDHLERRGAPEIVPFHPANGGIHQSTPWRRVRNSRAGVLPGIPDVIIAANGKGYALELKALGGRESIAQLEMLSRLRSAGWITGVAYGLDDAIAWLERHKLLIGRSI